MAKCIEGNIHSCEKLKGINAKALSMPDEKQKQNRNTKYHCSGYGQNLTHCTTDCCILKNQVKTAGQTSKYNAYSQKRISIMRSSCWASNPSSKRNVLDIYASVIKQEQSMLGKKFS
jgi:hypothetical protein